MDNGSPPAGDDQRQKESSVSLAASSMISASDMITQDAYQANLKRIQQVREMVHRLEANNEAAHKNFLVDQLEKRAKDGRDAEVLLARLRNHPGLSEAVQFPNNIPSDKPEVILPTTATLVEVEPHSSYSLPASTATSVQQGRPAEFQRSSFPQGQQVQSYGTGFFPYYGLPPAIHQPPLPDAAPRSQTPLNGQMGWYSTQNLPPQSRSHNPANQPGFQSAQFQQPMSSYPHPPITLPAANSVPGTYSGSPGYYISPAGPVRAANARSGTFDTPGFLTQSSAPGSVNNRNQSLPSHTPNPPVHVPLQGIPAPPRVPSSQPFPTQSHPMLVESRFVSTAAPIPMATSEFQRPHKPLPLPHPHSHQQQSTPHPQPLPQPSPQVRSRQPQHQPRTLPQPSSQSQLRSQESAQRPPQPTDRVSTGGVSQQHFQSPASGVTPSQSHQSSIVQEQGRQRETQPRVDKAMFVKLFQTAVQRGILQLKAFWFQAKVSGVDDDWLKAAINSLPRDVRESIMAQVNQSEPTLGAPSAPQQQVTTIHSPNVSVDAARPRPNTTPPALTTPVTQPAVKSSTSTEGVVNLSVPRQMSAPYAAQLQYYAEQATKSALSEQVTDNSTIPGIVTSAQRIITTPTRSMPQATATIRTPDDANKSTLARDVLRSLGKMIPLPDQDVGGNPMGESNNDESHQLPEVNLSVPRITPPAGPPLTSHFNPNPPPITEPAVLAEPQHISSNQAVLTKEREEAAVIEGPIMIDLTLEADESMDGKGQVPESTFPIQTSASSATTLHPVSTVNTTSDTPLMENLTLEEPPVDVPAGENLDVRMYSPPLPVAAEANTESELSYPPLVRAVPALPSFEPSPREASEQPLHGQLPLFLPSPPASPSHTEPPETDLEMVNDAGPSLKRYSLDEMGANTEVETLPRVKKRRKQQVYVLIPPAPHYVQRAIKKRKGLALKKVGSDVEGAGEDDEFQYSHLEQLLVEESKFRLLERRCRWLNCGAILNCAANLLAHLKVHAREEDSQAPFLCRWASCQGQFIMEQDRDVHLERHTIRPLPCPFGDCDERFDRPVEVMQHEVQHRDAERKAPLMAKPTCEPVVPAIPARLGPPPRQLASHRVIPRRVVKCRISAERHAIVGPWVLWHIFSPVDLNARKQNASMRGRLAAQPSTACGHDDYDFLRALSTHAAKNAQLDDLDSTAMTMSAARGLTLWGFEEEEEEDVERMLVGIAGPE